jgi:hypothetical protein
MKRGTVFLHKIYQFPDGGIADKFFIIVNNPGPKAPFLTCKTTSKQDSRPDQVGCHHTKNVYVLREKEDFFPKRTWVQFYTLYRFSHARLLNLVKIGDVIKMAELTTQTISAVVNCVKKSEDISFCDLELLKK